jgi:molecular chaperone DnaK
MMAGRLAIDFGTSNTVVALWDEARREGVTWRVPEFGRLCSDDIWTVPSLLHYAADGNRWIGEQVRAKNLDSSERTLRWMKRYVANRSPQRLRIDGRELTYHDAGKDFLTSLLATIAHELGIAGEEIALTAPVEAFEHYNDWLADAVTGAGFSRFRMIDEPIAAALGYGMAIKPNDVYLVFDFGGGTLDAAVVLVVEDPNCPEGLTCRVLGKAATDLGGSDIDTWLLKEALSRNRRDASDEETRALSRELLVQCERAKEKLSTAEHADVTAMNPETGAVVSTRFSQQEFERLLDEHEAFTRIDQTIQSALNAAREKGYDEECFRAVLMTGGSSLIPSVRLHVQRRFGRDRVQLNRPLDAVARGAAAFIAGAVVLSFIQHEYAIGLGNVTQYGATRYDTIIKPGTSYPTNGPLCTRTVSAGHDGMARMGIAIFEISPQSQIQNPRSKIELCWDPAGNPRLTTVSPEQSERRTHFWMNEDNETFLAADPPARSGEARFVAEFSIDGNRRLLITARDLKTNQLVLQDFPVVKLS